MGSTCCLQIGPDHKLVPFALEKYRDHLDFKNDYLVLCCELKAVINFSQDVKRIKSNSEKCYFKIYYDKKKQNLVIKQINEGTNERLPHIQPLQVYRINNTIEYFINIYKHYEGKKEDLPMLQFSATIVQGLILSK